MSTREPHRFLRRSRSPAEHSHTPVSRRRSRSPHIRHRSPKEHPRSSGAVVLPFQALRLHKHDYDIYKPMFRLYLEIQKQIDLEQLPDNELKGRWKSFLRKWNVGELAEGWYDPITLQRAQASAVESSHAVGPRPSQPNRLEQLGGDSADKNSDDDLVGPALPGKEGATYHKSRKSGPAIPNLQDLELQREMINEGLSDNRELLRQGRLHDQKLQKERLDELVPRAETGSKDRMLEKKREKADNNRAFASSRAETGVEEVPEADLLGGDDGGIEGFKQQKRETERKKNERELRREEILRARQVEREQRVMEYKAKEEKTMSGLVALAKARFG